MDVDGSPPSPRRERRARENRRRRRFLLAVAVVALVGSGIVSAVLLTPGGDDASAESPALLGTVASSTTIPPASSTTLALSQPENPPEDEYADVPVVEVGSIEIPRIGLTTVVYEGIWLTVLDVGPGHWPGTAAPGGYGNLVVAGHRATYSAPFRHIDDLVPGDTVVVGDVTGRYTYSVTGSKVVTPDAVDIVTQRPGHTITLFACHPPGSEDYRYVVFGTLVSAARPGA
ncbi:MAG: sortase [Acidimicrobiia bacterium]